jgi:hypothetical protein
LASPGRVDLHLAQHLADDGLEVLVVDVLALRAVHLLHLGHQVHLAGFASLDLQHAVRVERTLGQRLARLDVLVILDSRREVVGIS